MAAFMLCSPAAQAVAGGRDADSYRRQLAGSPPSYSGASDLPKSAKGSLRPYYRSSSSAAAVLESRRARTSPRRDAVAAVKSSADLTGALSRYEEVLKVDDCNILLRNFGESRRWNEASQLFEWMQKHGKLNVMSYRSYFKVIGLSQNPAKVLQVYDSISDKSIKINVSVCNAVLDSMVQNGRYESCFQLYDQMKREGLSPDLVTFNTLLCGCTKLKLGNEKALKLLKELTSLGFQLDGVMYGTLMAICASHQSYSEAEMYFQKMKDEGHQPNLYHYSSLLNLYAVNGDHVKAEMLIKEMRSSGLTANKVMLTTLLKVYSKGGLFEKAKELLSELDDLGYADDEISYCILIDNYAKRGRMHEAKELFAVMRQKGVKSDGYAYSIMISALCRRGLLQETKQLAEEFEVNYATYDLVMLNTLLRAYCNSGDMSNAMRMLKKMDDLEISPDWNTFQILIKFFAKEKLYHLAYKTIEDMNSKGHQLNEELCFEIIQLLGKAGFASEAFSVYNMLRYSKRNICKSFHEKMLAILLEAGFLKEAYLVVKDNAEHISAKSLEKFAVSFVESGNVNLINDVLKAIHRYGWRISEETFRKAILRYMKNPDKKELLFHLLRWMTGQGYCVDSYSRNLLLKNAHVLGQKQLIADILSRQQSAAIARKVKSED